MKKFNRWASFVRRRDEAINQFYDLIKDSRRLEKIIKMVKVGKILKYAKWCV